MSKTITDLTGKLTVHPTKRYADNRPHSRIKYIVVHHAAVDSSSIGRDYCESIANYHVRHNKWCGIGYHYVITKDGSIWKTNPLTTVSYHIGKYNRDGVGILLEGNLDNHSPTAKQTDSLKWLIKSYLKPLIPQAVVKGHREIKGYAWKSCPGWQINMAIIRKMVE